MKPIIPLFLFSILFLSFNSTQKKLHYKTSKYAGEYAYGNPKTKGPSGSVIIYPASDSSIFIYLDVNRGEPDYNLGTCYKQLVLKDAKGTFQSNEKEAKDCKLILKASSESITITNMDDCDQCGFGYGVHADGIYARIDHKVHTYFINGHGKKIFFHQTSPENYLR